MDVVEPVIERYVADLERALRGPDPIRRDLVAEARDHLVDATEAYRSAGWDPRSAAEHAVGDFGSVARVASGYQGVLVVAASRRCAVTLLVLLLPQAFLWDKGLGLASLSSEGEFGLAAVVHGAIEWLGFAALIAALATLVIASVGQRRVPAGPWLARWTGTSVAVGAVGSAVLGVALLALNGAGSTVLWALMVVLLVLPMAWTAHSARLCLRTG